MSFSSPLNSSLSSALPDGMGKGNEIVAVSRSSSYEIADAR